MDRNVTLNVNTKSLDEAIQKMSQLVELLREAEQIADSLFYQAD